MFTHSQKFYDLIYQALGKDYQAEAVILRQLLDRYGITSEALGRTPSLLDVACGTGGHLEVLHDLDCVGVDLDPKMVAIARKRCPGVRVVEGDMQELNNDELGGPFDVVCCLFSSIAYMHDEAALGKAIASMVSCLREGGLLIVEPFLEPQDVQDGHTSAVFVDKPEMKVARMNVTRVVGKHMHLDFHYLVAESDGVQHIQEPHVITLFNNDTIAEVIRAQGLRCEFDPKGLWGRGMHLGSR